ncbi:hypothetical protein [Microbacterium sp. Clip185]|uniref:hypothetical protein n=1 Tax=Microbacterium sp. Clip185 TaxID=3025663 RepID=UPI0023669575|nr:hypothetical protein [Microbacterium sp. Clip185]WDG18077.1 hypothetical protein PQV94_15845 [Microbacterium sp. Clip185]
MIKPLYDSRQRFGYALGALPGVVLHLLLSAAAWTVVQLNGLMVAGCSASRPCNDTLIYISLNGIQPALIGIWLVTAVLATLRPLVWGRNPWPVLGVGGAVSILVAGLDYLALAIGAGLL